MSKKKAAVEPQTKDEVKASIERMLAEHELPAKLEWHGHNLFAHGGEVAALCEERNGGRWDMRRTGRIKVMCASVREHWSRPPIISGRTFKATEKRHLQYEKLIPHLVDVITTGAEVRRLRDAAAAKRDRFEAAVARLGERFVLPGGLSMYAKPGGIEVSITADEATAAKILAAIAEERTS